MHIPKEEHTPARRQSMKDTEKRIEIMKQQTIGVEVEMYGIARSRAAEVAAAFFGTGNYRDTARQNCYRAWSAWDAQGREWKFQKDASIRAARDEESCEMVTPILSYEDIEPLQELIRQLRHAGAKSDPSHLCGVHVHIGASGHNARTLRTLANLMASHESLLISALRLDRNRIERYCRTVNPDFLKRLNKEKPETMQQFSDIWYEENHATYGRREHYNSSRYAMANYHAVFTKGTIEFRLFQFADPGNGRRGGLHAGELKSYIQLCLALSAAAKIQKSASPKEPQHENPKYAMRTWLLRLGFIGDEFATAREILTRNLAGDTSFRNGRVA
jgi:hypothetical protein